MTPLQLKNICADASRNLDWRGGSQVLNVGLTGLSKVLEVDRLVDMANGVQTRGAVAVSFASQEYIEIALEWTKAIQRCNISNYLIVCGDSASYDTLVSHGVPAIRAHLDADALPHDFRSQNGFTSRGLAMTALKFPVVGAILSQGLDVVLSDIDAIWCRDPYPFFPTDVDLAFQRVVYLPPAVVKYWGFSLCGGFVYFHNSPATRLFLQDCISWHARVQSDQVAANLALLSTDVNWDFPESYARQFPLEPEMAKAQFSAFSKISFHGVSTVNHLTALALSPEQFWRHPFIQPSNMVICHPNSPKCQAEKLKILSHWMDRPAGEVHL